jgi:Mn-containing catalase
VYERLINLTPDAGVRDALGFLMTREIAHQKSFEKALYAIEPNFPPGKLPGMPKFTDVYADMSQGDGNEHGPWNHGPNWQIFDPRKTQTSADGGDGDATVKLTKDDAKLLAAFAARTKSAPDINPQTGAELGSKTHQEKVRR